MFALKPRKETFLRSLLIAVMFFNALSPMAGSSRPAQAQGEEPAATPTETVTETPAAEPTGAPVPMETSTPPIPIATPVPVETTPALETLTVSLALDSKLVRPGEALTLTWTVEGTAIEDHKLVLAVFLPQGFLLQDTYEGEFDEDTRRLNFPVTAPSGQIKLLVEDFSSDMIFEAQLLEDGQAIAKASLFLPLQEQFVVDEKGGVIEAQEGKIRIEIPNAVFSDTAVVKIGMPSSEAMPPYSFSGQPFEITAYDGQSKAELSRFPKELTVTVSYADLNIPEQSEGDLYLHWYDPEIAEWRAMPTMVNTEAKTLMAFTNHFTVFDINANHWQATRLPTIDSFQVASFTGAATYGYPIELPSGPGGFQPSLSLSYNSQVVDQATFKSQASWVGMGWSLDTGYIETDTHGTSTWTGDDTHNLNVGGVSTRIVKDPGGVYHAADENFWRIAYDAATKVWTVWDKTGNRYTFEHKSFYPYQTGSCDTSNADVGWETYRWSLTRVTNIFGQEIVYTYANQLNTLRFYQSSGGQCNTLDLDSVAATYPETITYANGKYRVTFDREAGGFRNRQDYPDEWEWLSHPDSNNTFHVFERYRLKNILVEDLGANPVKIIRKYAFTYAADTDADIIFPGQTWSAGGKTSTLRSVQQFGAAGVTALPAVTFAYDNLHLTNASNGYGGSVQFVYEDDPWYYPTNARNSQTHEVNFGMNGYACYGGSPGTWHPRPGAIVGCGTGTYPPLTVQGVAWTPNIVVTGSSSPYSFQHSKDMLRPGGMYRLSASIQAQGNAVRVGLYNGAGDTWSASSAPNYYVKLPVNASVAVPIIEATGGANPALVSYYKFELLTSVYRVKEKRVYDGNGHQYTTAFSYKDGGNNDTARVNDRTLSPNSTCDPGSTTCFAYSETFGEFRGHAQVTETRPDGSKTVTLFHQDDLKKGRPISVTVNDGVSNVSLHEYAYGSVPLPVKTYTACSGCPAYLGVTRNWLYTDHETTTIYGSVGGARRVDYTYETAYGNLTAQADQYLNGSTWVTYRSSTNYFWPRNTADRYLVALPGKTKVFDGAGNTLATTLYLYDGNTGDHQVPPVDGKLTSVRTWMQNAGTYSQVSFTYDAWGNRTSLTTYSGYGAWNTSPATAPITTTTVFDPTYHVYPLSQTTPPTPNVPAGLTTTWTYDFTLGAPLSETDPNGNQTLAEYDAFGRIVKLIRPGDTSGSPTISIAYQDSFPFTTTLTQKVSAAQSYVVTRVYDGLGRQTQAISGGVISDTVYVSATETWQRVPYTGAPPEQYTKTVVSPSAHTATVYNPDGTSSVTQTSGLQATFTDANQHATVTTLDVWGRTQAVDAPTGPDLMYFYDPLDRLTQVQRTGVSTAYASPGTTSLVSWWSLNETSGTRNDSHSTNHLTSNNSVGYAAGLKGNAANFAPGNKWLSRADNASLSTGNIDFTLVANVYLNSTSNTMVIANKGDKNNQNVRDYTLAYSGGAFHLRVGNGTTSSIVFSTGAITAGQWYTVIAWHDAVNDTLNIQVNNGAVSTVSYSGGAMDTTFPLAIGAHDNGTFGLDGRIDELALYKRVLTASERNWLYNSGLGRSYADLTSGATTVTTTTTLTYDPAGRKTSMLDPDMGTWTYTYDALNNLKTQTDARGCVLTLNYDALSRLTGKSSAGSGCGMQVSTSYTYDQGANGKGLRTGMTDASGSTTWLYDARGRLTSESKTLTGAGTFATSWTYNAADMPLTMTYPGGETVTYGYNSRMLLESVIGTSTYVASTTYDAAGRMDLRLFGNGTRTDYDYYAWTAQGGRLQYLKSGTSGNPTSLQNLTYTYDATGNVSTILDALAGPQTQTFGYDALDRLTSAYTTGGSVGSYNETYAYDGGSGNLTSKGGLTLSYNDAAHVHAVTNAGGNTYQYDANGNQTTRVIGADTFTLLYDAENRLVEVKKNSVSMAMFVYDGDGRQVKSVVNGVTTLFVGAHYQVENGVETKYYFAGASRIAMRKNGTVSYLLGDHLGSTSITTNASGNLVAELRYTPWGETRYSSGTTPTSYKYTGQREESSFGLYFYNARWYDGALGRFTSPDTIIPMGQGVQAWDRFAYTSNNPVRYTDPTGHCLWDGCIAEIVTVLVVSYTSLHLFGVLPDYRGIGYAKEYVTSKDSIVGAGIAVQSEWYGPWDTRPGAAVIESITEGTSGIGIAQSSDSELLGKDPMNKTDAVAIMTERISLAQNACRGCTSTDLIIIAALAQNGDLTATSVKDILKNKAYLSSDPTHKINWDAYFSSWTNPAGDPIARFRETVTGQQYNTRFMLGLYVKNLKKLLDSGWTLPAGYDDVNWDYIHDLRFPPSNVVTPI